MIRKRQIKMPLRHYRGEAEFGFVNTVKKEVTFGASRFDLYFEQGEQNGFIEVKGVTLEKDGVCSFRDAPTTTRDTKHVLELARAIQDFVPNRETDHALVYAAQAGVQILAYDTIVTENEMILDKAIPLHLL